MRYRFCRFSSRHASLNDRNACSNCGPCLSDTTLAVLSCLIIRASTCAATQITSIDSAQRAAPQSQSKIARELARMIRGMAVTCTRP